MPRHLTEDDRADLEGGGTATSLDGGAPDSTYDDTIDGGLPDTEF